MLNKVSVESECGSGKGYLFHFHMVLVGLPKPQYEYGSSVTQLSWAEEEGLSRG